MGTMEQGRPRDLRPRRPVLHQRALGAVQVRETSWPVTWSSRTDSRRKDPMATNSFALARAVLLGAIRPALTTLGAGGRAAEQLLLGTAIQESLLVHRRQLGNGPARGLFQMEPATHDDCWNNYLKFRPPLAGKVRQTLMPAQEPTASILEVNDSYAAAMCRVRYLRVPARLPAADDIASLANYWKQHYNT